MVKKEDHKITLGIIDDHQLFVRSMSALLQVDDRFSVIVDAQNGAYMLEKLNAGATCPDIMLVDVKMPGMNGMDTAEALSKKFPEIRLVALTSEDDDLSIISMIKAGCCAYLLKDMNVDELYLALVEIYEKGHYNADVINLNYRRLITRAKNEEQVQLTRQELIFLKLACSDLTYKQIAAEMHLAERTIDGYRESVFGKFNVQSRVGMALEAIRRKLVTL